MNDFLVHEARVEGPATHVLAIGVGAYPHLNGGTGPRTDKHGGMGQLTSCPESARAFARWVVAELSPPAPLATVSLLLSEAGGPARFTHPLTGSTFDVEPATIDNVESALQLWRARGDSGPGMRLVFFFSGHGIAAGPDLILLAEDYGAKAYNALDGAFDFRNVVAAMDLCGAREQVYFVDACRVGSRSLLSAGQNNGRPVFQQDMLAAPPPVVRRAPAFFAALPGERAFGLPGQPSFFTQALLEGLRAYGADDTYDGQWQVTPTRLTEALEALMGLEASELGRLPVPALEDHGRLVIHRLAGPPDGLTIVECDPHEATESATLSCLEDAVVRAQRGPAARAWAVPLPEGRYRFVADFPAGPYVHREVERRVHPPIMRIPLGVLP